MKILGGRIFYYRIFIRTWSIVKLTRALCFVHIAHNGHNWSFLLSICFFRLTHRDKASFSILIRHQNRRNGVKRMKSEELRDLFEHMFLQSGQSTNTSWHCHIVFWRLCRSHKKDWKNFCSFLFSFHLSNRNHSGYVNFLALPTISIRKFSIQPKLLSKQFSKWKLVASSWFTYAIIWWLSFIERHKMNVT